MSVSVTLSMGNFPQGYCFTNLQQFANDLVALITASIPGNLNTFVLGNAVPSVGDQNKPWFRLAPDGTPDKWFIFVGSWISLNPRPPSTSERMIWTGTEASLWAYDGGDGTDPSISPPTDTTGAMWVRDTNFGADDGSIPFRLPVGIGKNNTTYDGNLATVIAIGATGGEERHSLSAGEMPPHQHESTEADGVTPIYPMVNVAGGQDQVTYPGQRTGAANKTDVQGGSGSPAVVLSHQNMPPFLGVIFAKRSARRFYVAT